MKLGSAPVRFAFLALLVAALACSNLPLPGGATRQPQATPAAGTAGPNATAPAATPAAQGTGAANAHDLLAIAVRLDGSQPSLVGYLDNPAQTPFTPPAGRYFVDVVDDQGMVLSLGAINVNAGKPVPLPASVAGAGGKADAKQASLLNTLGKFLVEAELTKLDAYAALSAGFTQPLFSKAVQPTQDDLNQLVAHNAEISSQEQAVLAAADTLQAQAPAAFRHPSAASRLAALAARPAPGLKDALLGFFGYARDTGKRARQRIIDIGSTLSPGDKADAFDALRAGFKSDAQDFDDLLAQLATGKLDNNAAQIESDLRNAPAFGAAAQQAGDTVGQVVHKEGGELVTKGVELQVEVIKTALGNLSPNLTKGYDLAEKGAKWAQFAQDLYNNPLNAGEQLARDKLQEKIAAKITSDLEACCPEIPSSAVEAIANAVSAQIVDAIPPLTANATGEAPAPKPDQFTKANLTYLGFKNTSAPGKLGPPNWCFTGAVPDTGNSPVPPLTVAPDGTLTGVCQGAIQSVKMTWNGSSSGTWDANSGNVSWSIKMNIKEAGYPKGFFIVRTLQIDGSAPVTEKDGIVTAEGTANYTDNCQQDPKSPGLVPCDPGASGQPNAPTSYSFSGTVDWRMTFVP